MINNQPSPVKAYRWFYPFNRQLGSWAFLLNRITAIGLTIYLAMHLIVLGKLAQGPEAYDSFVRLAHSPAIKVGELLVIAGGMIHGLNGIRIAFTSFGTAVRFQKQVFIGFMALALASILIFAGKMFLGG